MRTSIRKKIMPVLLALALIIGLFPILSVPAQAAGEIRTTTLDFTGTDYQTGATETSSGSGVWTNEDEKWSYDTANGGTLTLSGVNIRSADSDSGDTCAIKLPDGAKIELEAGTTNIVRSGDTSSGNSYGIHNAGALTIQGSGTLDATSGSANQYSYGIYSTGAMSIAGSTAVSAIGGSAGNGDSSGIYSKSGAVTIGSDTDSPTVTATGGTASSSSNGIYGYIAVTIDGGAVTATGGMATTNSCGIYSSHTTTISGGAVTATGGMATTYSCGITGGTSVTVTSGTVTATGGTATDSQGIGGVSVTVISGTVTATGGTATGSCGIFGVNITVNSGTVTATGGMAGTTSSGIQVFGSGSPPALNGGLIIAQSSSTTGTAQAMNKAASGTLSTALTGSYTAKFAVYGAAAAYPAGNISATAIDCTSYTGDVTIISGVAIWTQSTKTLTITNLILNTTAAEAITLPDGAKIALVGTSVIRSGDVTSADSDSTAVYGMGALAIDDVPNDESDGALIAIGGTSTDGSYGIWGDEAVTISGGSVTAIGNSTNNESCGIWSSLEVNISGGTVTAVGGTTAYGSYGIYGTTATNISGGTVTATGGTVTGSIHDGGSYGIYSEAAMGIEGGNVTATGGTANNYKSYGIGTTSITINGGTVTATGGTAANDNSCGIKGTSITINSGSVTVTGGTAATDDSYGIYAYNSDGAATVAITSGTVTASGGTSGGDPLDDTRTIGIYGKTSVAISGGKVTASGGTSSGTYTIGIYGKTSVAISGGKVTASGGTSTGMFSVGIFSEDSFAASGAATVITAQSGSGTGATVCAALAASGGDSNNIAFNDGLGVFDPAGGDVTPYGGTYYTIIADGTNPATYVVIKALSVTGVAVETAPTKVTYTAGDALNLSGLVVTLTKSGGSTQDVVFANFAANGLTTAPTNGAALATTDTTVTITHTASGKTASQTITVNAAADGGDSGSYTPSKTITVTETSSELFKGSGGAIKAEANVNNAFSNSVEVKVTDTEEEASNFGLGAGNKVYPFDISLYIKGTDTKTEPNDGYAVKLSLPIPEELLDVKEQLSIMHKSDDGTVTKLNSALTQINGVWYLVFEASEFSPYALVVNDIGTYDETAGLPYYVDAGGNETFIGFAVSGKYIAPEGVTVLVKQNAKSFSDIGSHWAKSNIDFVTGRELFTGTGGGTFLPDTGMTRAMFATVIGRLYERSYGEIKAADTHSFTDCNYGDYYGKYVDWAAEEGIIGGYGNGQFGPNDQISREQMAAILYRFADFLGVLPADTSAALAYPDAGSISSWAQNAARYCQSTGIITGRDGGSFAPRGTATRAEVAVILERFIENVLN